MRESRAPFHYISLYRSKLQHGQIRETSINRNIIEIHLGTRVTETQKCILEAEKENDDVVIRVFVLRFLQF